MNRTLFGLVLLAGSAGLAWADHPPVADEGGRLAESHGHRLELVTKGQVLQVLLKDEHNRPMEAIGYSGKAVVMAPAGKAEVPLAADGTRLGGSIPADAQLAAAVVALKASDGHAMNARFPALKPVAPPPAALAEKGKAVYETNCVACHGDTLQGQENWRELAAKGEKAAPALDATGHSWHHSDIALADTIRNGSAPMPAFGDTLADQEIEAVVAYIKSTWPAATLAQQPQAGAAASVQPASTGGHGNH